MKPKTSNQIKPSKQSRIETFKQSRIETHSTSSKSHTGEAQHNFSPIFYHENIKPTGTLPKQDIITTHILQSYDNPDRSTPESKVRSNTTKHQPEDAQKKSVQSKLSKPKRELNHVHQMHKENSILSGHPHHCDNPIHRNMIL
jgi:hypothetical protein